MYKKVSVLTPFYNRPEFLPLMIHNIMNQTYPLKYLEWVIIDDGEKPLSESHMFDSLKHTISPIKLNYTRLNPSTHKKLILGKKRNMLIKKASNNICINMDDDDLYSPHYIEQSLKNLLDNNYTLVGSNQMFIIYPYDNMKIKLIANEHKRQIHEATMCFTKKHVRATGGFTITSRSEGVNMIDCNENTVGLIGVLMICVSHKKNTIDKNIFDDRYLVDVKDHDIPDIMKDKINILNKIIKEYHKDD